MADYSAERMPPPRRQQGYGYPSDYQRDAAFNTIFGAAPPGRSQTMTSSSSMPPQQMPPSRTMSNMPQDMQGQRMPPPRPPPGAEYGYDGQPGPPRVRPVDTSMAQGYYAGARSASGTHLPSLPAQHLQQQRQPPQLRPSPGPPSNPGQMRYPPPRGPPPPGAYGQRPPVQRFYEGQQAPGPAVNSDPYRTQSLASAPRQPIYQPPQTNGYQQTSAGAMRQAAMSPPPARTTAQGRVVPGRGDDRTMSLQGGYPNHDRDSQQTMSGRVIPNRSKPSPDRSLPEGFVGATTNTPPGAQTRQSMQSNFSDGRTMSMASTIAPSIAPSERSDKSLIHKPSVKSYDGEKERERPATAKIRPPIVYPALLSKVAECFRNKIIVGDRMKDELTYTNAFSGREAVDVLSYIIRTTDRNLALLLGRALDAQKFFHDVTYEHRLRDSMAEMYQFKAQITEEPEEKPAVNGVFVLLSECYSPTCTRDQLCYSIACPRRLEQVSRLNLKIGAGLKKDEMAGNDDDVEQTDEQKLWINSVSKEVAASVPEREQKRQEVISEMCYTERDFCKDLEYLRDFWILPLRSQASPIPPQRRARVTKTIYSNIIDEPSLHHISMGLAKALTERQQAQPVVQCVGDIFLEHSRRFEPFITYGSKQLEGKLEFENERNVNPNFSRFVDEIERRKESRKLELNGYLTKPTTRLARYPLLLESILKYTSEDSPDRETIPQALKIIRSVLSRVNEESGKAENRVTLTKLHESLRWRPNDRIDLRLTDENRELIHKTNFKKSPSEQPEITAYLFDHAVLLVKVKQVGKVEQTTAYRRPIPLELLSIKEMEEVIPNGTLRRTSSSILPNMVRSNNDKNRMGDWPITFKHLGKAGYELTLYAPTQAGRQKWLEFIDAAQQRLRNRIDFFSSKSICQGCFSAANKVNCVSAYNGGRGFVYGTDNGIYVSDKNFPVTPRKVLDAGSVTQMEILEEYNLLLVLSNKSLVSYSLAALDPNEPALHRRPKKIQNHCSFFRAGVCTGRHLVCAIKPTAMSTTIKVYEPNDAMTKSKHKKGLGKVFGSVGQDEFKPFKEFYIPSESSSVHFLKSKICVACARGFEVVSLETLETQSLLDQADTSLDFVSRREGLKPIHIARLSGEFLLNYSEFSFFVNRNGWRARPDWRIDWEGVPTAFALVQPWLLAFETNFIEFRSLEHGAVHIVPHKNIRLLYTTTYEIIYAYEDEAGQIIIEQLDFYNPSERRSQMPPGAANGVHLTDGAGGSPVPSRDHSYSPPTMNMHQGRLAP